MKLTVLADNTTLIDHYYLGEPAVCYYIEDEGTQLLLDAGYSDVFMKNAETLGIDLSTLSAIAFSHGHDDHTRGLQYLCNQQSLQDISIVAHPDTFKKRVADGLSIGSPLSLRYVQEHSQLTLTRTPRKMSKNITFLGEIPSLNDFERRKPFGMLHDESGEHEDVVMDDSALVYSGAEGLFVITGCSHSGICNIVEYAKQVCNDTRITGIIGGFHLFDVTPQLAKTIEYFQENAITELYPCHCVSFAVKAAIHSVIPLHEVGVGLVIEV